MPSQAEDRKSLIAVTTAVKVPLIASHTDTKKSLMAFHTVTAISLTFSQRLIQNSRNPSQLFQR